MDNLKCIFFVLLMSVTLNGSAQELTADNIRFVSFNEDTSHWPKDNNGNLVAKIMVESTLDGLDFDSDMLKGNVERLGNGYMLYVIPQKKNRKKLRVRHDNYSLVEVAIWDASDKPLESGSVYVLTVNAVDNKEQMAILNITTMPSGASVMVDDKPWPNPTPCAVKLTPDKVHALVISKLGYTSAKKILKVSLGEKRTEHITLQYSSNTSYVLKVNAPESAVVMIDKEKVKYPYEKTLPKGMHIIECLIDDQQITKEINLDKNTTFDVSDNFEGKVPASEQNKIFRPFVFFCK